MRNNFKNFSGTELQGVGAVYGPGLYFSEAINTAQGYAGSYDAYDSVPIFVLEAAGKPGFWEKSPSICTSLFPHHYHHALVHRPSPHTDVVVRGLFLDHSNAACPTQSHNDRGYFEKAQAAYATVVGASDWGQLPRHFSIISPNVHQGLSCSAMQPFL
jgi:hypothetical protein